MEDSFAWVQLIWLAIQIGCSAAVGLLAARWWLKKEQRIYQNIRREVLFVSTDQCPVDMEHRLLAKNGLYMNVVMAPADDRVDGLMANQRLVVLGYSPGSARFWNAFEKAKANNIYTIVYARDHQIPPADMTRIRGHLYHSLATTPLRLMADVFAIMATAPQQKGGR